MIYLLILSGLLLITAAVIYGRYVELKKEKERIKEELRQLEMRTSSLELETIKYKLNPHLFKNTLNSILSHAYQTYNSLDKLANVLDYILYESDRQFVPLKDELNFVMSLIEINKLKLSPLFDLRIKNNIDESDSDFVTHVIAPLITVDLIENAFNHADIQSADAFISIVFELRNHEFSLLVTNKISKTPPIKKPNSGLGKRNLQKRLDIVYSDCYSLDQYVEKEVYTAHLRINLLEHKLRHEQIAQVEKDKAHT